MIRLPSLEPAWHELPGGLRVFARPLMGPVWSVIQAHVRESVRAALENLEKDQQSGGSSAEASAKADGFDPGNATYRAALTEMMLVKATLILTVQAWEGLSGEDGEPLPVTPETVGAFADRLPVAAEALYRRLLLPLAEWDAEKNSSSPAPSGTSAAGAGTAASVPTSGSRARAGNGSPADASAPTSSTLPAP